MSLANVYLGHDSTTKALECYGNSQLFVDGKALKIMAEHGISVLVGIGDDDRGVRQFFERRSGPEWALKAFESTCTLTRIKGTGSLSLQALAKERGFDITANIKKRHFRGRFELYPTEIVEIVDKIEKAGGTIPKKAY